MSKKTGRPKEQGGHHRINISVDKATRDALQQVGNRSKFIEYIIHSWMKPQRIRFHEPKETVNHNQCKFKDAAVFDWTPSNSEDNAVLSVSCYFRYHCGRKGFRFRVTVNDETIISSNGWLTSISYTSSPVYSDRSFVSDEEMKVFPNQASYTIRFQFQPRSSSDTAHVKDINVYLEVADGMSPLSP